MIGLAAAALGTLLTLLGSGPLLAAVATAAVPAALTRGLHLDGLADTADGLGSGKPADDALRIMKQSDIGPFGVITLLFTLLAQVAALSHLSTNRAGPTARQPPPSPPSPPAAPSPSPPARASRQPAPRAWGQRWPALYRCAGRQQRRHW
ncbi:Adenosylcobinamide-GDP ribazoletransferase [Streptomyces rimosus subsp. rimosus]